MKPALVLLTICYLLNTCIAWDQSELEIFDLVEEVNANFYEVLGISQVKNRNMCFQEVILTSQVELCFLLSVVYNDNNYSQSSLSV